MTTDTYVETLAFARRGVSSPQAQLKGEPFACAGLKNPRCAGGFERQKDRKYGAEAVIGIKRRRKALQRREAAESPLRLKHGEERGDALSPTGFAGGA
jgi:hypothetical protein